MHDYWEETAAYYCRFVKRKLDLVVLVSVNYILFADCGCPQQYRNLPVYQTYLGLKQRRTMEHLNLPKLFRAPNTCDRLRSPGCMCVKKLPWDRLWQSWGYLLPICILAAFFFRLIWRNGLRRNATDDGIHALCEIRCKTWKVIYKQQVLISRGFHRADNERLLWPPRYYATGTANSLWEITEKGSLRKKKVAVVSILAF